MVGRRQREVITTSRMICTGMRKGSVRFDRGDLKEKPIARSKAGRDLWIFFNVYAKDENASYCIFCDKREDIGHHQRRAEHLSTSCRFATPIAQDIAKAYLTENRSDIARGPAPSWIGLAGTSQMKVDKMGKDEQEAAVIAMATAMVASGSPFTAVSSPLWTAAFRQLRPAFRNPSRDLMKKKMLDVCLSVEFSSKEKIRQSKSDSLCISADTWTDRKSNAVLAIVVLTPHPVVWDVVYCDPLELNGAQHMAHHVSRVVREIGSDRFVGFVGDNENKMQSAKRMVTREFPWIRPLDCAAHAANLMMEHTFDKIEFMSNLKQDATNLVRTVNNTSAKGALFDLRRNINERDCSLVLPVPTRWGTYVECLRRVLENEAFLPVVLKKVTTHEDTSKNKRSCLDPVKHIITDSSFYEMARQVYRAYSPVCHFIKEIESNDATTSLAFLASLALSQSVESVFKNNPECSRMLHFVNIQTSRLQTSFYAVAALLDPRLQAYRSLITKWLRQKEEARRQEQTILGTGFPAELPPSLPTTHVHSSSIPNEERAPHLAVRRLKKRGRPSKHNSDRDSAVSDTPSGSTSAAQTQANEGQKPLDPASSRVSVAASTVMEDPMDVGRHWVGELLINNIGVYVEQKLSAYAARINKQKTSKSSRDVENGHQGDEMYIMLPSRPFDRSKLGSEFRQFMTDLDTSNPNCSIHVPYEDDPVNWWTVTGAAMYPNLAWIARYCLSAVPTSAAVERVFSNYNFVEDENRIRLQKDSARLLVMGYCNIKFQQRHEETLALRASRAARSLSSAKMESGQAMLASLLADPAITGSSTRPSADNPPSGFPDSLGFNMKVSEFGIEQQLAEEELRARRTKFYSERNDAYVEDCDRMLDDLEKETAGPESIVNEEGTLCGMLTPTAGHGSANSLQEITASTKKATIVLDDDDDNPEQSPPPEAKRARLMTREEASAVFSVSLDQADLLRHFPPGQFDED